jgi:hypothetical protein
MQFQFFLYICELSAEYSIDTAPGPASNLPCIAGSSCCPHGAQKNRHDSVQPVVRTQMGSRSTAVKGSTLWVLWLLFLQGEPRTASLQFTKFTKQVTRRLIASVQHLTENFSCTGAVWRANSAPLCSSTCSADVEAVCGNDGRSYANRCLASCAGVEVSKPGYCSGAGSCSAAPLPHCPVIHHQTVSQQHTHVQQCL